MSKKIWRINQFLLRSWKIPYCQYMATSYHLLSPSQLEGWKFDPMPLSLSEPPQRSLGKSVPLNRPDKTTLLSLRWPQQWQVNISSWMDWAREPMKTSLSSRDSTESNAKDKNIPLHLKFLRKIHICAFAVLNFCQNFEKNGKHVLRIPFSLSDLVLALRRPPEYSTTGSFRKKSDQALLGGSRVSKSVDQEN